MNVFLLYQDKEWVDTKQYFDHKSITQDLGLETLFTAASKEVVYEKGNIKKIEASDIYMYDIMKKVMMVPLNTEAEIKFRQAVVKDCMDNQMMIRDLYDISTKILVDWEKLGRRTMDKVRNKNTIAGLMSEISILSLFARGLERIKKVLDRQKDELKSTGFIELRRRLNEEFSEDTEKKIKKVLQDISFYQDNTDSDTSMINKPRIVFECGIEDGLKIGDIKLEEVASKERKYRGPKNPITQVQKLINAWTPGSTAAQGSRAMEEQTAALEFSVVSYIVAACSPFMKMVGSFFDQLHLQTAFYLGAVNLQHHIDRFEVQTCFPVVTTKERLLFRELKEIIMCMEQRVDAVGNTCKITDKMLLIVTGANQGGKSTFLRSIGIAQIMFQCGLMVAAESFESAIFPSFFTHFTRREDSEMNSGRLDEELGRMNQIIDNVDDHSLILLNESFATTTEKEGSVIAYDIIKALVEAGVKVLTVTHLLSFAQRVFAETNNDPNTKVAFLSAERMEDGERTYKMIQHAPELTSFGLDLYEEIIEKRVED